MLSRQSLEILIDLVEIKLSAIMMLDRDDVKEVERLKTCKSELLDFKRTMYSQKMRSDNDTAAAIF
ncbi:MAG: hypothetical protein LBB21_00025 [Holosporaceae bacterium]|jgi:hypothetical protein|nr:hypothetical protein [Holosporaceae bacterium]